MAKSRISISAAERKLAAAFSALEAELDNVLPAPKRGKSHPVAAESARSALNASIARLREAVGKV